ncbi:MAG: hemerythrin domain-containing protein [Ilumatobacteraceae bacterium]|nr:MAG: hemerythrin domain-containing protein [Actinomycetota bacterium]
MAIDPGAPADTNMMRIVHSALRRDLERAQAALTAIPPPNDRQRIAIAGHLEWMMGFLEAHHRSEDLGLYPVVRERAADAAALLDDMAADHAAVADAVAIVEARAAQYGAGNEREPLIVAIERLQEVLLPHLQREEDELMPIVSRVVKIAEWNSIEQAHNIAGKSTAQLGREGHWLIDGATHADRARVLELVPVVPRYVLLYGFGPSYRRRQRACWNPRLRGLQNDGSTSVVVDADLDAVWDIIRDPTRVGEWSHECVAAEWVGDTTEARPGAIFRGRNRQGMFRWGRLCEIVSIDPGELVWRTVPTRLYPDSTEWALRAVRVAAGTRIEQSFHVVKGTWLEAVYARLLPAHRERTAALTRDLERIGTLARARPNQPAASPSANN